MNGTLIGGGIRGTHQELTSWDPGEIGKCGLGQSDQYSAAHAAACTRTMIRSIISLGRDMAEIGDIADFADFAPREGSHGNL